VDEGRVGVLQNGDWYRGVGCKEEQESGKCLRELESVDYRGGWSRGN
jgi:hypothetical protein